MEVLRVAGHGSALEIHMNTLSSILSRGGTLYYASFHGAGS